MSSSDLSRNSKQFLKTASPYSSTNSLNSMDSSGMSTSSRGNHPQQPQPPPVPPQRKKRAAPRPPSQNSIPEQTDINFNQFKEPFPVLPRKNFHVSSPNLVNHNYINVPLPVNGNIMNYNSVTDLNEEEEEQQQQQQQQPILRNNKLIKRPISMNVLYHDNDGSESDINHNSHSRTSSDCSESKDGPEPVPRKRLFSGL